MLKESAELRGLRGWVEAWGGGKNLRGSSGSHRFINVLVLVNKVLALPQNLLCQKFSVGLKIGVDPNFGIGLKLGFSIKFFVGKNMQN